MFVKELDKINKEPVKAGKKVSMQVLISSTEGPHFAMRKFTIEPGGSMPEHTNSVEHEQLVLNGIARISIAGKTFEVKKNDIVFIPHWYETIGSDSFEFLCMVPSKEDKIEIINDK
jgi:quercetin dioxygenase-like cupin family protein